MPTTPPTSGAATNGTSTEMDATNPRDIAHAVGDLSTGHQEMSEKVAQLQGLISSLQTQLAEARLDRSQPESAGNLQRLEKVFGGNPSESPKEFLYQLEVHQRAYCLSDRRMLCVLEMALRDRALDWFRTLEPSTRDSYGAVIGLLRKEFDTRASASRFESILFDRKQRQGESWEDFAKDIRQLSEAANITDPLRCGYFIRGLRDPLRNHLHTRKIQRMIEAEREAVAFQSRTPDSGLLEPELIHTVREMAIRERASHRLEPAPTSFEPSTDPGLHAMQETMAEVKTMVGSLCAMQPQDPQPSPRRQQDSGSRQQKRSNRDGKRHCVLCNKDGHNADYCRVNTYCPHCKETGHPITRCKWAKQGKQPPTCYNCGKKGHTVQVCRKPRQQQQQVPQQQYQAPPLMQQTVPHYSAPAQHQGNA